MPVLPRRRDEIGEPVEELKRRELDDAVCRRLRGLSAAAGPDPVGRLAPGYHVTDATDAAVGAADHGESLQCEGRPGALSQQVLETPKIAGHVAVKERDPDTRVDGRLSGQGDESRGRAGLPRAPHILGSQARGIKGEVEGVWPFVSSRVRTFFRRLRHETDGTSESVQDRESLPDCDFRVWPDHHAIWRSFRKRTVAGLWYRGSRVRVPLAALENKGFVIEGFVSRSGILKYPRIGTWRGPTRGPGV